MTKFSGLHGPKTGLWATAAGHLVLASSSAFTRANITGPVLGGLKQEKLFWSTNCKLATTPEAMKRVFARMPGCCIAMETGTHSPWVSRLLTALGHEVIVGHAQNVRLNTKSRRKDDRLDARTLTRLARIDPHLLSPVKDRSG
jgi:hypothetical protein